MLWHFTFIYYKASIMRRSFTFNDLCQEATIKTGTYTLDNKTMGATVIIPTEKLNQFPFNASAYDFLQFLRPEILEYGIIELPNLPVNKSNYTLAQRAPQEHSYSTNSYLTDFCQSPHQDTPPYPTAFWLPHKRKYFATWIMGAEMAQEFYDYQNKNPKLSIEAIHQYLVPLSLQQSQGFIANQNPGLLLIDNSEHHRLYHARTCNFAAIKNSPDFTKDTPMYAFNEVGLLNYLHSLDSRRGNDHINPIEIKWVQEFMQTEGRF